MASLLFCAFGTSMSFYLLISVVPLYVGGIGAGFATGALMFATVAADLMTPALLARFGYRRMFAAGMVLLGVPALALPAAHNLAAVLAICAVRGVGFGITVVVGTAVVAVAMPPERRGEGLGLYGIVCNVPAIIGLPLGLWLATNIGYTPVFVAGAAVALAGFMAVPGLPTRAPSAEKPIALGTAVRNPALAPVAIIFAATTLAGGAVATFLPLAVGRVAALALFVQAAAATISRWWAGRYGDRHGAARLLAPSVLVASLGIAALILINSPAVVLIGMLVFGVGYGAAQNASLATMYDRVSASGYDTVSGLWNLAYDVGYGLGGAGFGLLALRAGYPVAFGATAVLMALTLVRGSGRHVRSMSA